MLDTINAGGKKGAGHKERDVAYLVSLLVSAQKSKFNNMKRA